MNKLKKILFLGAAHFQLPPLIYAKKKGYLTITCDNVKSNPGHKISHKSYNVSTTDIKHIIKIAQKERIDGILAFGSDLSMVTCAFVSNKLELPGNNLKTIKDLVYKSRFRKLLNDKEIQKMSYKNFTLSQKSLLNEFLNEIKIPHVIKPIDSNGSKGVSIIYPNQDFKHKVYNAFIKSYAKEVILEPYIESKGPQICGDGMMKNGELICIFFGDGHFYPELKYLAPWGETFPTIHSKEIQKKAKEKIHRTLIAFGFNTGVFNFDILVTLSGDIFINEIGPRSGGNFIPTVIKKQTGVNMIKSCVEESLGNNCNINLVNKDPKRYFGSYMIHSKKEKGRFSSYKISKSILDKVHDYTIYKKQNDLVEPFFSGDKAIGNIIFQTDTIDEMRSLYANNLHDKIKIKIL